MLSAGAFNAVLSFLIDIYIYIFIRINYAPVNWFFKHTEL